MPDQQFDGVSLVFNPCALQKQFRQACPADAIPLDLYHK
jgi:hypothetical protein